MLTTIDEYSGVPASIHKAETGLSYHLYYHYSHWHDCENAADVRSKHSAAASEHYAFAANFSRVRGIDMPVLASEFGQSECYCPAAQAIQAASVGWILWELMLAHDQFGNFQGLLYANGTARSAEEISCLMRLGAASDD